MKAVVAAFNQEKALVGAFSVIVKTDCGTNGSFYSTSQMSHCHRRHWDRLGFINFLSAVIINIAIVGVWPRVAVILNEYLQL